MFVRCDKCGYDSGDFDSMEEIAKKVREDEGVMNKVTDGKGEPRGWRIECPNCRTGDYMSVD